MFAFLRRRVRAQAGSEYMMVISVVTIAAVGAAFAFVPSFRVGVTDLGADVQEILSTGESTTRDGLTATGPGGNGPGGAATDTRHTRTRQNCVWVFCFGETRETALGGGTGGDGDQGLAATIEEGDDLDNIDGAWKSFFQGEVAKAAQGAEGDLADQPLCGPAIIAAMTGKDVNTVYKELENNGRLALVKKETVVGGVVMNTEYTTTGVMSQSQLAAALRDDYGFQINEKSGGTLADVESALDNGQMPIVLYDNGDGSGKNGHFGVVTDVSDYLGVKVDTATGSFWIPKDEFQQRMDVMGGKVISASPPSSQNGTYAQAP